MTLVITIILILVSLIGLLGGLNILIKGAGYFLPEQMPAQLVLDNVVRFLAGIYFGLAFLFAWAVFHISELSELIYFLGIIVLCAGLGRLYSRIKVGPSSTYLIAMMWLEVTLGLLLIICQYLR